MIVVGQTPELSPFDEARAQLDAWEKSDPDARHVILILAGEIDLGVTVTGPVIRPTEAAGMCLAAANTVLED